jgi:riboflavin biosynthesis pyrimidine reductase
MGIKLQLFFYSLRLHMDCILIGIDTLLNDGPRLTGAEVTNVCGDQYSMLTIENSS